MNCQKVLVFGSGISGIGASALLEKVGKDVILYDGNTSFFTAPFGQLAPSQGLAGTRTEEQLGSLPAGTPASPPRVLGRWL